MSEITLEYLLKHKFKMTGLEENFDNKVNVSRMFSEHELSLIPRSDEEKITELKIKMSDCIREKCGGYKYLHVKTNLNPGTVKKILQLNEKRTIKKEVLAKLVVGAGLTLEEANEMFSLHSSALNPATTQLDAVVVHCLEKHLDINGFFDTCQQINLNIAFKE